MLNLKAAFKALVIVGLFATPTALAETTQVSMSIEYDIADLGTNAGAKSILETISLEAKSVCTSYLPVSAVRHVDDICVSELESGAKTKIIASAEEAGLAVAPVFIESTNLQVASYD